MAHGLSRPVLHLLFAGILVSGCSSDPEPSEKDPPFSNVQNNTNNANASNNMVGTACETEEDCPAPDPACRENVAISVSGNGICQTDTKLCNYFFVTEEADCNLTQQACEDGACVDTLCTGVECPQPEDRCEGNTLVYYVDEGTCSLENGTCSFDEFQTDCVAEGGECMFNTCVGACVGVLCTTPPSPFCDEMTGEAVTFGDGTCNPGGEMAGECAYPENRETCQAPQICRAGACVDDPCENVDCTMPPPASCQNNMAVTYTGAGVCDPSNGMCNFSSVETVQDCGAELCIDAACVDTSIAAGDLVITEIMTDPENVLDDAGEWFEVINVTTRPLDLDGLAIGSAGDAGYSAAFGVPTLLQPGERYVFGNNSDSATNGGVSVSLQYTDIVLDSATDSITLSSKGITIDEVVWDSATWPATPGAAMVFGANYDPAVDDNALATNWCDASSAISAQNPDLGTPGAPNDTCM